MIADDPKPPAEHVSVTRAHESRTSLHAMINEFSANCKMVSRAASKAQTIWIDREPHQSYQSTLRSSGPRAVLSTKQNSRSAAPCLCLESGFTCFPTNFLVVSWPSEREVGGGSKDAMAPDSPPGLAGSSSERVCRRNLTM